MSRRARLIASLLLAALSLTIALVAAELVYRWILSNDAEAFAYLRRPVLYADGYSDDNYWKLLYRWSKNPRAPKKPHPLLGWVPDYVSHDELRHSERQVEKLAGRRAVLLYGDSFAQGVVGAERIQDVLGRDPAFSADHLVLNYGVGGYGLDQIYKLFRETIDLYEDPFVIFSFLTYDMDRTIRTVSTGQKPYFEIVDGRLELRGTPISSDPEAWFAAHPPKIFSYVWNRFIHIRRKPLFNWTAWFRDEKAKRRKKLAISEKLLDAALAELRRRDLDFEFLIFHPKESSLRETPDWREEFLQSFFGSREIEPLGTKEIFTRSAPEMPLEQLFIPGDGHPTTLGNELVAREIKEQVLRRLDDQGAAGGTAPAKDAKSSL